jgi:hypothetical protein
MISYICANYICNTFITVLFYILQYIFKLSNGFLISLEVVLIVTLDLGTILRFSLDSQEILDSKAVETLQSGLRNLDPVLTPSSRPLSLYRDHDLLKFIKSGDFYFQFVKISEP